MSDSLTVEEKETHVLVSMDDGKANALGFEMLEAISGALDVAEQAGKVVVLAGRPGKFSAGFDLKVMTGGGEPMLRLLKTGADLSRRIYSFPTPVVLAVSGHALAMGALLCLSADYRIGMQGDYKLGLNEVAIGMTLPWFGIELAQARLDETQVSAAVGLAKIFDPEGAVSVGYLDEAVAPEALLARAEEMAAALATLDMKAHIETKLRLREDSLQRLDNALTREFESAEVAAVMGGN